MGVIFIKEGLSIPEEELVFTASRSSGPGGQHVNKVSTRMTLFFDVAHSPSLSDDQRRRILYRLGSRINRDGVLQVSSQDTRSQAANRQAAEDRFAELLRDALKVLPHRHRSAVPRAQKRRRMDAKRHRAAVKRLRSSPESEG